SSLWLTLVTDVDTATGRALVDSMTNEVIVRDNSIRDLIPFEPMPYDDAVRPGAQRTPSGETRRPVTARRRAVIATGIGGAGLLRVSLSSPPGSRRFYLLTMGLAGTWAVGALGSGPLPVGRPLSQRHELCHALAVPVLTGAGAFGLFYGAARIARRIPVLDRAIGGVLRYEHDG